jgi:antitoxin ParD1/3/4
MRHLLLAERALPSRATAPVCQMGRRYASSSEVIREALREWKARRAARSDAIGEIRRLWDEGIKSGPSKDLNVSAIKKRGRQRLKADRK